MADRLSPAERDFVNRVALLVQTTAPCPETLYWLLKEDLEEEGRRGGEGASSDRILDELERCGIVGQQTTSQLRSNQPEQVDLTLEDDGDAPRLAAPPAASSAPAAPQPTANGVAIGTTRTTLNTSRDGGEGGAQAAELDEGQPRSKRPCLNGGADATANVHPHGSRLVTEYYRNHKSRDISRTTDMIPATEKGKGKVSAAAQLPPPPPRPSPWPQDGDDGAREQPPAPRAQAPPPRQQQQQQPGAPAPGATPLLRMQPVALPQGRLQPRDSEATVLAMQRTVAPRTGGPPDPYALPQVSGEEEQERTAQQKQPAALRKAVAPTNAAVPVHTARPKPPSVAPPPPRQSGDKLASASPRPAVHAPASRNGQQQRQQDSEHSGRAETRRSDAAAKDDHDQDHEGEDDVEDDDDDDDDNPLLTPSGLFLPGMTQAVSSKSDPRLKRAVRARFNALNEEAARRRAELLDPRSKVMNRMVYEADTLHTDYAQHPREHVGGVQLLNTLASHVKDMVDEVGSGSAAANIGRLIAALQANYRLGAQRDAIDWQRLGEGVAAGLFRTAPGVSTLVGPLDVVPKARKKPVRTERQPLGQLTRPDHVADINAVEEVHQLTDHVCELMHQVLTDAFRAGSSGGGVPLTNLVCDDERYSATLENIFALSFLVRDGRVRLSRDVELGVMVTLVPRPPREQQQQQRPAVDAAERQQFVMELQHRDWEVMVRIVTASGGSLLPSRGAHDVEGSSGGGSAALRPLGAAAAAALPSGSGGSSSGVGCSRQQAMPRTPVAAGATTAAVVTPPVAAALQSLQTPAAPARPAAQSRLAVVGGSSNGPLPQPALGCSAPVQQLPPLQPNTPQQPRGSPRGPRIDLPPAKRPRLQD